MPELVNFRPLTALSFLREATPQCHAVFRSAGLSNYGLEGVKCMVRQQRVSVYVDLRTEAECLRDAPWVRRAEACFVRVLRFPIETVMPPPATTSPSADDYLAYYLSMLRNRATFACAFIAVAEHGADGVVFGCAQGKDRTGLLAAALLETAGRPRDEILDDYAVSMRALAESTIVAPRYFEERGLSREDYMRRYDLGSAPLRALLEYLESKNESLLALFREGALDPNSFLVAETRISRTETGTSSSPVPEIC